MRARVLSDLHFEFHRDEGHAFVKSLGKDATVDLVILAGDIAPLATTRYDETIAQLCAKFPLAIVVWINGNHEYYSGHVTKIDQRLETLPQQIPNLRVLRPGREIHVQGHRVIGGTLWFPDHPDNILYRSRLADFAQIRGFIPWVYTEHAVCVQFLRDAVRPADIVVTHHLPSMKSVHPRFLKSDLNRFFVVPLDDLILERQPAVWVHGHNHDSADYRLGQTRVLANPFGYARLEENPAFDELAGFVL